MSEDQKPTEEKDIFYLRVEAKDRDQLFQAFFDKCEACDDITSEIQYVNRQVTLGNQHPNGSAVMRDCLKRAKDAMERIVPPKT